MQLLVGTLYGDTAIDTAAPGSELLVDFYNFFLLLLFWWIFSFLIFFIIFCLLVDAACLLGLGPERFPTSVISLPDLCSLGGGRNDDILHEIERLSKDLFSQMESSSSEDLNKEGTDKNETASLLVDNNEHQTSVIQVLHRNSQRTVNQMETEPSLSLLATDKEPLGLLETDSEQPLNLLDCLSNRLQPQTPGAVDQTQPGVEENLLDKALVDKGFNGDEVQVVDKAGGVESERPKSLSSQILACDGISLPRRRLLLSLLTCSPCDTVCKGLQERTEHVSCSPPTCVFSTCGDVLPDWDQLMQHLTKMHRFNASSLARKAFRWMGRKSSSGRRGPSLLSCNICGEECSDPSALSRHMGNHGGKDRSTCEICSKEFRNKVIFGRKSNFANCGKKSFFLR